MVDAISALAKMSVTSNGKLITGNIVSTDSDRDLSAVARNTANSAIIATREDLKPLPSQYQVTEASPSRSNLSIRIAPENSGGPIRS